MGRNMGFITAGFTGKGGREVNEDTLLFKQTKEAFIAVVADGLGMHGGGKTASKITAETISNSFLYKPNLSKKAIANCFDAANKRVLLEQKASSRMKSTAAVLFSNHRQVVFAHIGDSRIYYFSGHHLKFQTLDHSVSQMAVSCGEITPMQIRFHEDRNRLVRAIGGKDTSHPDIGMPYPLKLNDSFLLCTDGFWEYVTESEMENDLIKSSTPRQWISYMLARIGKRISDKNDNLSVLAIFYRSTTII